MSGTLHHSDDDRISRPRATESEITHRDSNSPTRIQKQGEPIAFNNPEKAPETENPKSITTSKEGDADSIATPDSTGSMEVKFDVTYDLEAYLEEFFRFTRKGKFYAAIELFHACPPDLKNHPEFILDFMDKLLRQGAYKSLVDFAVGEESVLMTRLSDCGVMPMHYLRSVFELGRWRVFGSLDGSLRDDLRAGEVQEESRSNFEKLDSVQVQLMCNLMQLDSEIEKSTKRDQNAYARKKAEIIMRSSSNWHGLYKHLLSTNRIWDMRDLFHALYSRYGVADTIKLLLKNQKRVIASRVLQSDDLHLRGWFYFVLGWTQCSPSDESTDFALLDLLVTMSLQLLSHSNVNEEPIKKTITQAMTHANHFAISLSFSNPENVQTSPYLKWVLANQKLARELPVNVRQTPNYTYLTRAKGVVIWTCNLPIFIPVDSIHDRDRVTWNKQSRSTSDNLLQLGLNTARTNGDYVLVARYLEEMFYTSDAPLDVLGELAHLQRDVQGDGVGYLRTCLAKYLCVGDETSMEEFSNELEELDQRDSKTELTWKVDPVTRWCQRVIQSALSHHLGRPLQMGVFLEEKERAYEELPCDFKRLLAELGTGDDDRRSRFDTDNLDESLSEGPAESGKGTLYRDRNFIICDSSGYFSKISSVKGFERGFEA